MAPPGSGKTTALAQWAERGKRRFAWVSLDRRDNDPVVLLSYLAEALSRGAGVDPAALEGLTAASLWTRALPRLGVALASLPEPFVLVLDDVHELEDPECLDALAAVLGQVPQGSQLVLCGRTEARLGLAKLRADGELLELGRSALALNDREAHALLTAAGLDVTETEARALNERAEGWAAGLYLAALSLEAGDSSLASFGGDDRFVTDYLRAEELGRVKPAELDFLLRTAVLDRMCGPLCDAVLERQDSTRCSSRSSATTCSWSPSTTSARGSATTICSGRCWRPSSSGASPSSSTALNAERAPGSRRTASPRSRSSTWQPPATPTGSPGS